MEKFEVPSQLPLHLPGRQLAAEAPDLCGSQMWLGGSDSHP